MRQKTIEKIRRLCNPDQHKAECECGYCQIISLCDREEYVEQMSEDVQELITLANVTASYMDMTPQHPLYCSVGRDVRASLARLFNQKGKADVPEG